MDKIKILAFSDIHGHESLLEPLREKAKNVDLVMICGDYTGPGEEVPKGLIGPFLDMKKPVFLLHGNHESNSTTEFVCQRYDIPNIHTKSIVHKDIGIFGASASNIGLFRYHEKEIFKQLDTAHKKISHLKKKIMMTHVHPSKSVIDSFCPHSGSDAVRHAITTFKPDIAICGHVHEAEGTEEMIGTTRVVNVSMRGKILEL